MSVQSLKAKKVSAGTNFTIGENSCIQAEEIIIGDNVCIGKNVVIKSNRVHIGNNTLISDNNTAEVSDLFELGICTILGKDNSFHCRKFMSGDYLYMGKQNEIGGGGSSGPNSEVSIGKYCMIVDRVILNTSEKIEIGDDVGIGTEVMIWTHGSYNAILDGFPANFAPVKIGSHVWIPARIVVLPGISIGDNVVISINSLINKDIPSGSLAAGIPAKVIKENYYPKTLSEEQKTALILPILEEYKMQLADKNLSSAISYDKGIIHVVAENNEHSFFNIFNMTYGGVENSNFEDLRDFLRRKGIKYFTGKMFSSIQPMAFRQLNNF